MEHLEMNETREYGRVAELSEAIAQELQINKEFTEWLLSAWLMDDQGLAGIALQLAAAAEFGCDGSQINPCGITDTTDAQAILRHVHENSRRKDMTVYRGTSGREGMPLESWTADQDAAKFYALRNGGTVVERIVSAADILATWRDGIGLECAQEVVIINRRRHEP